MIVRPVVLLVLAVSAPGCQVVFPLESQRDVVPHIPDDEEATNLNDLTLTEVAIDTDLATIVDGIPDGVVDMKVIDRILTIAGPEAMKCSKDLATKEGIFVGITAGATLAGALKVAADAPKGANILCMLPDTGERYLSTPLFADIPADMTDEEREISRSTPGFHMPPPVA